MTDSHIILNHVGPVDFSRIDLLLSGLKETLGCLNISKATSRKVYAIVVECLENIFKYSAKETGGKMNKEPSVSVLKRDDQFVIKAANPIEEDSTDALLMKIDKVNSLDLEDLKAVFNEKLNSEKREPQTGAGLGFILMKLKSGNKIGVSVKKLRSGYNYLELTICVNEQ